MRRILYTALLATALLSAPAMANSPYEFGSHARYNSTYTPDPAVNFLKKKTIPLTASDIVKVQKALHQAGYNPGPIDGVYGWRTRAAMEKFQEANALVTESAGQVTFRSLTELGVVPKHQPAMRGAYNNKDRMFNE